MAVPHEDVSTVPMARARQVLRDHYLVAIIPPVDTPGYEAALCACMDDLGRQSAHALALTAWVDHVTQKLHEAEAL